MKRLLLLIPLMVVTMAASCKPGQPGPGPSPTPTPKIGYDCEHPPTLTGIVPVANARAGRYIVVLKNRTPSDRARMQPLMSAQGVSEVKALRQGYAARLAVTALDRILSDPNVAYVQMDGVKSVSPLTYPQTAQALSWGLDRVDQRDLPLDGRYDPTATGEGVNVAIIDTGVSNVPDFESRLQTDCFTAYAGCADGFGHGTHVAGTVGGKTWGVAKKANLWISRVLDENGSGSDSDVIRGIEWVVDKKQTHPQQDWIGSMSLGGSPAPALDQAVCDAIVAGVTMVIAAGNESEDAKTSSPARVIQAVTVGAEDKTDRIANFSNYGTLVDLFGPGVQIESDQPGGGTAVYSGTSMATPHVSGGAALYLARNPGAQPAAVLAGLLAQATLGHLHENDGGTVAHGSPDKLLYVN